MKKPELILPAGNFEKLQFALAFGADAVYAGVPLFSLRARENRFTIDDVKRAIEYTHKQGKRIYLTCNIFAHNNKISAFLKAMEEMIALQPDAFIMADLGLISLVKERWPDVEIHVSTQANTTNWAQIECYKKMNINHVVLARELSLMEIKQIHQKVPDVSLEAFVHGAMCFAYSGRCMISNYLTGRDSNQGMCSQSCRWEYKVFSTKDTDETVDIKQTYTPLEGSFYLEETERPGELMRIDEDEHGTYFFNSRDLCMIQHIDKLVEAGVSHFKVEGRNKTPYYAAIVARAYRRAIDAWEKGEKLDEETLLSELASTANRGFTPGLFFGSLGADNQRYDKNASYKTYDYLGIVKSYDSQSKRAEIEVKNRFEIGDECEIVTPQLNVPQKIRHIFTTSGDPVTIAHGGADNVFVILDNDPGAFAFLRKKIDLSQ